MKIGIGTAQFGLNYGVTNIVGTLDTGTAHLILDTAIAANVVNIDTAPSYGASEKIIGQHPRTTEFKITTKIGHISDRTFTKKNVAKSIDDFKRSLRHLRVDSCYGLLIHNPEDVKKENFKLLVRALENLKNDGLVQKIGISAYDPADLELARQRMNLDIVQIPLSILNQKFVTSKYLEKLKGDGVEIHARSIFLQGLILSKPNTLPKHLYELRPALELVWREAKQNDMSVRHLAMQYVIHTKMVDLAVLGVTSAEELNQVLETKEMCSLETNWAKFNLEHKHLINPANWEFSRR